MQRDLFELFAITGARWWDAKILGASACVWARPRAITLELSHPLKFFYLSNYTFMVTSKKGSCPMVEHQALFAICVLPTDDKNN